MHITLLHLVGTSGLLRVCLMRRVAVLVICLLRQIGFVLFCAMLLISYGDIFLDHVENPHVLGCMVSLSNT
jgi:hypothetical protein